MQVTIVTGCVKCARGLLTGPICMCACAARRAVLAVKRLRLQQLLGAPAGFRQLQPDIDIQPGLMAGVTAAETSACCHAHVTNQHVAQLQVMHLRTEPLNKLPLERAATAEAAAARSGRAG